MRNSVRENISEHSLEVAMLAHGLAIIANEKCGQELDPNEEIDLIALPLDPVIGEMGTGISDNALMTAAAALVMKEERKRGGKLL